MAHNYEANKRRNQDLNLRRFQSSAHNHYIILSHTNSIRAVEEDEVIYPRSQRSGCGEEDSPIW